METVTNYMQKPEPKTLFPTMGSTQEVIEMANSKLPVECKNEMYSVLMTYHNTLLKEISNGTTQSS